MSSLVRFLINFIFKNLFDFLKTFLESCMSIKLPNDLIQTAGICQNCFIKFNEIDEHQLCISKIQNDLIELFNVTQSNSIDSKIDVKPKEIEFLNEHEGESEQMLLEVYANEETFSDGVEEYTCEVIDDDYEDNTENKASVRKKRGPKKKKNLDEGLIMVEVDGRKMYQCEICQKVCKDRYKLKNHKETHNEERNVCCTECGAM